MPLCLSLSSLAQDDMAVIAAWSLEHFGEQAAEVGFGELERGEGYLLETPEAVHQFFNQVHAEARSRQPAPILH